MVQVQQTSLRRNRRQGHSAQRLRWSANNIRPIL